MPQYSYADEKRGGGASQGNRMKGDPGCEQSSFHRWGRWILAGTPSFVSFLQDELLLSNRRECEMKAVLWTL
jgi:hypothetical protein